MNDEISNEIKEIFKNHKARFEKLDDYNYQLDWGYANIDNYSYAYLLAGTILTIIDEMSAVVCRFRYPMTFESLATLDREDFAKKIISSTYPVKVVDPELFKQFFKEILFDDLYERFPKEYDHNASNEEINTQLYNLLKTKDFSQFDNCDYDGSFYDLIENFLSYIPEAVTEKDQKINEYYNELQIIFDSKDIGEEIGYIGEVFAPEIHLYHAGIRLAIKQLEDNK